MSYARSPRPVCSITIGTRLACMALARIVPASPPMRNFFTRSARHDLCAGHQMRQAALAQETRMECRARLGPLVEGAHALGDLPLAGSDRADLGRDLLFGDGKAFVRRDGIEEKLDTDLPLRSRAHLGPQTLESCFAVGSFWQLKVEVRQDRVAAAADERGRDLERMPR